MSFRPQIRKKGTDNNNSNSVGQGIIEGRGSTMTTEINQRSATPTKPSTPSGVAKTDSNKNKHKKMTKMIDNASALVANPASHVLYDEGPQDVVPVFDHKDNEKVMDAVSIRIAELRKQRQEIYAIDLKRMENDLLYKLFFTEDI